jgi:GTP-binding protein
VGVGEAFPRTGLPEIVLAGRSNVGKSSLVNRLVRRRALAPVSTTPGKTRAVRFYEVERCLALVDLPGYGYAKVSRSLRRAWKILVEAYFATTPFLVGAVHVVDIRHPGMRNDKLLWEWLGSRDVDRVVVATKADKVPRGRRRALTDALKHFLNLADDQVIVFSAVTGEGKDTLWRWLWERRHAVTAVTGGRGDQSSK